MECPNCKKQINFIPPVYRNLETYGGSAVAVSECCNSAFNVTIKYSFNIIPYTGNNSTDSWGNPIKQKENDKEG